MSGFGPPPGAPTPEHRARRASYLPPGGLGGPGRVLPGGISRYAVPTVSRPGIVPLRPLGLADVLDGAVKLVRRSPGAVIGWAAIVCSLAAVPLVVAALTLGGRRRTFGGVLGNDWAIALVTAGGLAFGLLMLTGVLAYPVAEAVLGRRVTARQIWQAVRPRLWPLLAGQFAVAGVVVGPWVLVVVIVTVVNDASVLAVLAVASFGGLLALAANAWAVPRLVFLGPVIVLEERGLRSAWARSWQLSRRRYWAIVGTFITCTLIVMTLSWVIFLAFLLVVSIALDVLELPYDAQDAAQALATAVSVIATASLITPFLAATTALQYVDSRMRTEGFDLVLLRAAAERLAAPGPTGARR